MCAPHLISLADWMFWDVCFASDRGKFSDYFSANKKLILDDVFPVGILELAGVFMKFYKIDSIDEFLQGMEPR